MLGATFEDGRSSSTTDEPAVPPSTVMSQGAADAPHTLAILPIELREIIAASLDPRSLGRLLCTSVEFGLLVERILRRRAAAAGWELPDVVPAEDCARLGRHSSWAQYLLMLECFQNASLPMVLSLHGVAQPDTTRFLRELTRIAKLEWAGDAHPLLPVPEFDALPRDPATRRIMGTERMFASVEGEHLESSLLALKNSAGTARPISRQLHLPQEDAGRSVGSPETMLRLRLQHSQALFGAVKREGGPRAVHVQRSSATVVQNLHRGAFWSDQPARMREGGDKIIYSSLLLSIRTTALLQDDTHSLPSATLFAHCALLHGVPLSYALLRLAVALAHADVDATRADDRHAKVTQARQHRVAIASPKHVVAKRAAAPADALFWQRPKGTARALLRWLVSRFLRVARWWIGLLHRSSPAETE